MLCGTEMCATVGTFEDPCEGGREDSALFFSRTFLCFFRAL